MHKVCIIGAGQLGSRHLQGILKSTSILEVYVVDPGQESRDLARSRASEVNHDHKLTFYAEMNDLPEHLDVVIVATNSNVRENIINQLFQNHTINYLILEKVLFQDLEAYQRIEKLLLELKTKVFVNHPRRMFGSYIQLKELLIDIGPVTIQVSGGDWGLACNSLHFLDLFEFLFESKVSQLDTQYLNPTPKPSKRDGYVEFTGTLSGALENGSIFQITSFDDTLTPITIIVSGNKKRYLIQESVSPGVYEIPLDIKNGSKYYPFNFEYQSNMTTTVIKSLLSSDDCILPTFMESARLHSIFITELLRIYKNYTKSQLNLLPIT